MNLFKRKVLRGMQEFLPLIIPSKRQFGYEFFLLIMTQEPALLSPLIWTRLVIHARYPKHYQP